MDFCIGVDSERIDRFSKDEDKYCRKLLSTAEVEYFKTLKDAARVRFLASRFSAKEAIFKAIGTGIDKIKFSDVTILPDKFGKPVVSLACYDVELSITYNDQYVTTFVILKKL